MAAVFHATCKDISESLHASVSTFSSKKKWAARMKKREELERALVIAGILFLDYPELTWFLLFMETAILKFNCDLQIILLISSCFWLS